MLIVVMGVSGSGKSTIGRGIAERLNLPFFEGDDYHPRNNVEKMSKGIPLNDRDRKPWLETLSGLLLDCQEGYGAVFTCSALKESYRTLLSSSVEKVHWIFLHGPKKIIMKRMQERKGHFMKAELLDSQFSILEEPEDAIRVDLKKDPNKMINNIISQLLNE
ncbi:gluconokinase [Ekhidna sp.]